MGCPRCGPTRRRNIDGVCSLYFCMRFVSFLSLSLCRGGGPFHLLAVCIGTGGSWLVLIDPFSVWTRPPRRCLLRNGGGLLCLKVWSRRRLAVIDRADPRAIIYLFSVFIAICDWCSEFVRVTFFNSNP